MMSPRHAPLICLLAACALVPTVMHTYVGAVATDGRQVEQIPTVLAGWQGEPASRDARWGQRRFEAVDWFERNYKKGRDEAVVTVLRSYDLKRLYHHPELELAYGNSYTTHAVVRVPDHPDVPIHVLRPPLPERGIVLYVLHSDDTFVEDPVWFQIRSAAELLYQKRKPMTLFFLRVNDTPSGASVTTLPATELLFETLQRFLKT